ncbi:hypothetical protein ACJX0J_006282, partial [Zea mays]
HDIYYSVSLHIIVDKKLIFCIRRRLTRAIYYQMRSKEDNCAIGYIGNAFFSFPDCVKRLTELIISCTAETILLIIINNFFLAAVVAVENHEFWEILDTGIHKDISAKKIKHQMTETLIRHNDIE